MTRAQLTTLLAEQVMGWKSAPGRFVKSGRTWIPDWRFAPFARLEDAFFLLNRAAKDYELTVANGRLTVEVRIAGRVGTAVGDPKAETITGAVVRALGLDRRMGAAE
jgi:hypothetical protein